MREELDAIAAICNGTPYRNGYKCHCPLHDDRNKSLLITLSDSNRIITTCLAGCDWKDLQDHFKSQGIIKDNMYKKSKDVVTETYYYEDSIGDILFEKQRLEPEGQLNQGVKRFLYRRKLSNGKWIWKDVIKTLPKTIKVPLYKLPNIFKADTVYIVEGEKCVNSLLRYLPDGTTATTNHDGAGKWQDHYNSWLAGKVVYILQDNDEAGEKHTKLLVENLSTCAKAIYLVTFKEYNETIFKSKYDVANFLDDYGYDALDAYIKNESKIVSSERKLPKVERDIIKAEEKAEKEERKEEKKKEKAEKEPKVEVPRATYDDYIRLTKNTLGELHVDVFSESLVFNHRGTWQSARNALGRVKSEADDLQVKGYMNYSRPAFDDHIDKFEASLTPKLLITIPQWDGEDRIGHMASCLIPHEEQGFTPYDFDQLITDWLVKAYRRVLDPNVRQRIMILRGEQHIGKDWWIESLLQGAGQFIQDMHINAHDKDTFLQLSQAWFLRIGEFDKTARLEVSVLKEMVTKPYTDLRSPYERDRKRRWSRCSFISGGNIKDLLRDPTGATRYLILHVDKINYNYPVRNDQYGLQLLAQARWNADNNFQSDPETEAKLKTYLDDRTPSDMEDELIELYMDKLRKLIESWSPLYKKQIAETGRLSFASVEPVLNEISRSMDLRIKAVQGMLINRSLAKKVKGQRVYLLPFDIETLEPLQNTNSIPFDYEIDGVSIQEDSGFTF